MDQMPLDPNSNAWAAAAQKAKEGTASTKLRLFWAGARADCHRARRAARAVLRFGRFGGFRPFFATLQAGIAGGSKLVLELFNPASRVQKFQLASKKWMARAANVHFQLGLSAARFERAAAATTDLRGHIIGVNAFFHRKPEFCK
jgi:hypothetical protein